MTVQEVKEGSNCDKMLVLSCVAYYLGEIANNTIYPFQKEIIMNQNVSNYHMRVSL